MRLARRPASPPRTHPHACRQQSGKEGAFVGVVQRPPPAQQSPGVYRVRRVCVLQNAPMLSFSRFLVRDSPCSGTHSIPWDQNDAPWRSAKVQGFVSGHFAANRLCPRLRAGGALSAQHLVAISRAAPRCTGTYLANNRTGSLKQTFERPLRQCLARFEEAAFGDGG